MGGGGGQEQDRDRRARRIRQRGGWYGDALPVTALQDGCLLSYTEQAVD